MKIVVLGGGIGRRYSSSQPKQFEMILDKPVLIHSLISFLELDLPIQIVLVIPSAYQKEVEELLEKYLPSSLPSLRIVSGGVTRHDSFLNGVRIILEDTSSCDEDIVLIHDAARPFISSDEISRLMESLQHCQTGVASLASLVTETIVKAEGPKQAVSKLLDRTNVYSVKTPQVTRLGVLKKMISLSIGKNHFTDLITWAKECNIPSVLAESDFRNIKITEKKDIELLRILSQ